MIATSATARDGSGYIGIDAGVLFPRDMHSDIAVVYPATTTPSGLKDYPGGVDYNLKTGYDLDAVGGYDFGMFRVEGELGYKHSKVDGIDLDSTLLTDLTTASASPTPVVSNSIDLVDDRATVFSAMINGLFDFNLADQVGGSIGAGFGRAHVKRLTGSDNAWAWQLIAGIHTAVSENIDVGLKYRYFRTGGLNISGEFDFGPAMEFPYSTHDHFTSHSLLLSLAYNFAAAAPPPPPAPPPPLPPPPPLATQTCPDGSVILATDACPAPPPPPPPPVERGERG